MNYLLQFDQYNSYQVGQTSVYELKTMRFETVKTLIGTLELLETTMTLITIKTINVTRLSGSETSFGQSTSNTTIFIK